MKIGIKPLGSRVVLKKDEAEERTTGGIILTKSAKEQPQFAEIVATGPGSEEEPMELTPGDRVVFSKYVGTEVSIDSEEYLIMNQADVLAIIE